MQKFCNSDVEINKLMFSTTEVRCLVGCDAGNGLTYLLRNLEAL